MTFEIIYNQYLADQRDGFVSNNRSYFESILKGKSKKYIDKIIKRVEKRFIIIKKMTKKKVKVDPVDPNPPKPPKP